MGKSFLLILIFVVALPGLAMAQGFEGLEDISGLPPQDTSVQPAAPVTAPTPTAPTAPTTEAAPTGPEESLLFIISLVGGGVLFVLMRTYLSRRKTDLS